ncbi:hypothetical protein DL89DRAFT_267693 [Linderina pennispora]|uniref:RlpA-like protein double-psi beta-barrel domain-containing protein n=1 Tax=Linderina pennispora TaxID=61395 RepID=A0A1Y1W820_9FUNG|nr:uncharacterized protein DL89DRAFT_267693 [Linderina pennispora]ORX69488.1 hypothetical protein DL89DRAFT_267693 [Linderina pennispora]
MKSQLVIALLAAAANARSLSTRTAESNLFSGDGTYFSPGTSACREQNTSRDLIAALNAPQYGDITAVSPHCGRCALVRGPLGQAKVKIVDACPECVLGSLDLSLAAFEQIAHKLEGRVKIIWEFVAC